MSWIDPSHQVSSLALHGKKCFFSQIFDPNRPLAHFRLSPGQPGGPGQAGAQKVEHLSAKMQKLPKHVNFIMCF